MKNIAIIGSTGSIGASTLQIVRTHPGLFRVRALAAKKNVEILAAQAREFRPEMVCLYDAALLPELKRRLAGLNVKITSGPEGLIEASTLDSAEIILFALVGAVGLEPLFAALEAKKTLAIANKEPLVIAGGLLMKEAKRLNVDVLPIDSEHSGLWQCLEGRKGISIKKLILTSSGGPFRGRKTGFAEIKPKQALKHPKWKMGPKITIDSATLMNKGLEVIEAVNLFGMPPEKVEVLIHPEAIIHAMVEFVDGSHLAHLGITDMRLPIQYALSYPERLVNHLPTLDFAKLQSCHFETPDRKRFPCLELGYEAAKTGGTLPAVLNAANEIAVEAFLNKEIAFTKIPKMIEKIMAQHRPVKNPRLADYLEADRWARQKAEACV
jgi:1-deoxy-D-xylulose-5-phosphate reductoisomerase